MVKRFTTSAVVAAAITLSCFNSTNAQTEFPWRSTQHQTAPQSNTGYRIQLPLDNLRVAQLPQTQATPLPQPTIPIQHNVISTRQPAIPLPPKTKNQPLLASFKKVQGQQVDVPGEVTSPSIPNIGDYSFDVPDSPATNARDLQYSVGSPEPQLQVAKAPEDTTNYCARDCRKPFLTCDLGCEKKLFGETCNGFSMGGWTNFGYHNRDNNVKNNREDRLNLHQLWLYGEKAASRNSASWSPGFRVDGLYGIDAQDLQAFGNSPTGAPDGWDNGWDNGSYGFALPQMYVQLANYEWDVKLGKFFSPFGYEVIGATGNFFYSNNYTMYNSEPFTMTGVLAEKQTGPNSSLIFGATAGWDTGFDRTDGGFNVIAGLRRQLSRDVRLSLTSSLGDTGARGSGIMTTAVTEVQLTDSVSYVLHGNVLNLNDNNEFGIVQYLFRDVTDCLAVGARLEWWKSDAFFGGPNRSTYDFTVGANYRRNANLVIRPELRFDWGARAVDPGAAIVGIDAVMTF